MRSEDLNSVNIIERLLIFPTFCGLIVKCLNCRLVKKGIYEIIQT